MQNKSIQAKIELLKKIVNADLTAEELEQVTKKAQELLNERQPKKKHKINVYDQTDTAGILKECLGDK